MASLSNGQQIGLAGVGRGLCRCSWAGRPALSAWPGPSGPRRAGARESPPRERVAASPARCPGAGTADSPSTAGSRTRAGSALMSCDCGVSSSTRTSARARPSPAPAANLAAAAIANTAPSETKIRRRQSARGKAKESMPEPDQPLAARSESSAVRHPSLHAREQDHGCACKRECEHESQQAHLPLDAVIDHLAVGPPQLHEADLVRLRGSLGDGDDLPGTRAARPPLRSP